MAVPLRYRILFVFFFCLIPIAAFGAFGLTTATDYYQVDNGAGTVFKVRRTDNGSSTQSAGDLMSIVYNGVEYQDQSRGSQVNSGFDYLYNGISAVMVSGAVVNTNYVKITVTAGNLTHYYLARKGYPYIYLATYFTTEPDTLGLCRYIVRIPRTSLPNGPTPSDIHLTTSTIESSDIFALADGTTRSKHYSNQRLKDWSYIGATGANVGIWMVRDNNEGNSGGPFFRCLLNQAGDDQEITYIVNYGEGQTEAFRTGVLNSYFLAFTTGAAPAVPDVTWFDGMGLTGFVGPAARGAVAGSGISGRDANYAYTVGFANASAQYWADGASANGAFTMTGILPGTYKLTVYKNELAVSSENVDVTAGTTNARGVLAVTADPSATVPLWRIGNWDGTPGEFRNGDKINTMHPSDVRMAAWSPGMYVVGTSTPATGMPCYQWKDVNGSQSVQFNLTAAQLVASTVRIGITTAYANARPRINVNSWTSAIPGISDQPDTRTLTVGTYRGNNTTYTFSVPASAFVAGTNTLTVYPVSGSGGTAFLSAGYSLDCVDMFQGAAQTLAVPNTPTGLTATSGDGKNVLTWAPTAGAASYTVQRAPVSTGPFVIVASGVTMATYTDTGLAPGVTSYYVVGSTNTSGASAFSLPVGARTAQNYGQWSSGYFSGQTDPAVVGLAADPDRDGRSNLLEYFLGTNPTVTGDVSDAVIGGRDAQGNATLTFRRSKNLSGVTYAVQQSDGLAGWNAVSAGAVALVTDQGGYEILKATVPVGTSGRIFLRVWVSTP